MTLDPPSVQLDVGAFGGAVKLLGCLEDQIALSVGGPVCQASLYPGASVPMDFCGDDPCTSDGHGMAAVRVVNIQLLPEQTSNQCQFIAAQMAVTYEMTVLRCAHTIQKSNGTVAIPTTDELASDTAIVMDDAAAMRKALKCCFGAKPATGGCAPRFPTIGPWLPRGPAGGCMGGQMQITVIMNDCGCP